jgi:hypothetical protein
MALPVVASRATGCADAVVDGVTGLLVETRDARGLERAVRRYLEDAQLRHAHGEAARARVLRHYRPEDLHRAVRGLRAPCHRLEETHDQPVADMGDGRHRRARGALLQHIPAERVADRQGEVPAGFTGTVVRADVANARWRDS